MRNTDEHRNPEPGFEGQKGLEIGIANEHPVAYGCAGAFDQVFIGMIGATF